LAGPSDGVEQLQPYRHPTLWSDHITECREANKLLKSQLVVFLALFQWLVGL
jgi:hypothetical protein